MAVKFDMLPKVLLDTFSVSTSIGDSVVAKRVLEGIPFPYPIELPWWIW